MLPLQTLVVITAAATTVHVDGGAFGARLADALADELPAASLVASAAAAALRVQVEDGAEAISVRIEDRAGRALLTRRVPLTDGEDAALRIVVLLVARTVAERSAWADPLPPDDLALVPPPDPEDVPERPGAGAPGDEDAEPLAGDDADEAVPAAGPAVVALPAPARLHVGAGGALLGWQSPAFPQLGVAAAGSWVPEGDPPLGIGGRVAVLGLGGRDRSTTAIDARAVETLLLVEVRTRLLRAGRLTLDGTAGAGPAWLVLEAVPAAFAGDVDPLRLSLVQAVALAAAGLRVDIAGPFQLRAEAGGVLRINAQRIRLPPALEDVDDPVDTGVFVPFATLGIERPFP